MKLQTAEQTNEITIRDYPTETIKMRAKGADKNK